MNNPDKFDSSSLNGEQTFILADFFQRRNIFDNYLTENKIRLFTCPGCGYPTLRGRGGYEICSVCNWEDDYQDDKNADEIWGGPNYHLSLTENRLNIGKQLKNIAEEINGEINMAPAMVLKILSHHSMELASLLQNIPEDAEINHPNFREYEHKGKLLLRMLVTK
jgi:hypothetical protein